MPKLDAQELWRVMKEQAAEDEQLEKELAAVSKMTEAQLDEELRAAGFSQAQVERAAAALHDRAHPVRRRRWVVLLAAATLGAGAVAVSVPLVLMSLAKPGGESAPPPRGVEASTEQRAAQLRRQAAQACEQRQWTDCERALDAAKALDPAGEDSPPVKKLRQAIEEQRR